MSVWDRAKFQMRGSSSCPAKNPRNVVPFDWSIVASVAGWVLSERVGWPTVREPSSTPFR
jgi:hypothetical protein